MNNLVDKARSIPVPEPTLTVSYSPVTLPTSGRAIPLELRITAPAAGGDLPILLLSTAMALRSTYRRRTAMLPLRASTLSVASP